MLSLKSSTISGYHGAEHKVIGGRERKLEPPPRVSVTALATPRGRRHLGRRLCAEGARTLRHQPRGPTAVHHHGRQRAAARQVRAYVPGRPAAASAPSLEAALEALRWATRHGDSLAARVMMSPGRLIQKRLTTSEPTPAQLEVAERAMKELLGVGGGWGLRHVVVRWPEAGLTLSVAGY